MSDHYFACAREKNCVGIKKDMGGFHKCAAAADCKKPAKVKRKKTRKEKITEIVEDAVRAEPKLADVIADVIQPRRSTRVRKTVVKGSGSASPWIAHVKQYQHQHGCSYKEALIGASKTYH
jgi:hypothetical protein